MTETEGMGLLFAQAQGRPGAGGLLEREVVDPLRVLTHSLAEKLPEVEPLLTPTKSMMCSIRKARSAEPLWRVASPARQFGESKKRPSQSGTGLRTHWSGQRWRDAGPGPRIPLQGGEVSEERLHQAPLITARLESGI